MYSTWCCLVFIVAVTTAAAVLTDQQNQTEKPNPSNPIISTTSTTATPKSSSDDPVDAGTGPRKRTIEQTVGYGYRYNTVLRPVSSASAASAVVASGSRNRAAYQRGPAAPMTPSPTSASYYFQQQVQPTSPKTAHRFSGPFTTYPRYTRPESSETRPVTENPLPVTATAALQPHQDVYREVFTFDEAMPSPYHIAPRAEHPQILPQALLLTPATPHHHQQVIPVLILRLDTAAPFPYPMMAMHLLREDMAKYYAPQDPAAQLQHYADPASNEAPAVAYYMPDPHQQARSRAHPMSPSQPDRYRSGQEQLAALGKVPPGRRPSAGTSPGSGASAPGTRTEVTIHHSPGMTAQDYKESIEQEEEA